MSTLLAALFPPLLVGWTIGGAAELVDGEQDTGRGWAVLLVGLVGLVLAAWVVVELARAGFWSKGGFVSSVLDGVAALWRDLFGAAGAAVSEVTGTVRAVLA